MLIALLLPISNVFAESKVAIAKNDLSENSDIVLNTLEMEMMRSFEWLQNQEIPPYWIEVAVTENQEQKIITSMGALVQKDHNHHRHLDIDLRVGDYQLDNTHTMIDGNWFSDEPTHFYHQFPISNDPYVMQKTIWETMDEAQRTSARRYIKLQTNSNLKVEREDQSADFSKADAIVHLEKMPENNFSTQELTMFLQDCSTEFLNNPDVLESEIILNMAQSTRWIVTTDGTKIREVRPHYRLSAIGESIAEDGMRLTSYEYKDMLSLEGVDIPELCSALVQTASNSITELRNAPLIDPYVGPAILHGRAAAVFFHEILGHRSEGHRQKDEEEGQTLTDKVNAEIFPTFINVVDDPTLTNFEGEDLNGHYRYDDEGVAAQKVNIIENGVLKNFLMGRSPIEGFEESNGHGRRSAGRAPVSRQGNLIVSSTKSVSYDALKAELIKEIKAQNKPFGLIFDDISGGFTFTGRNYPNSYVVKPVTVWRIYPDGREEMVRGVDMIGTPLITFSQIALTSDRNQVFNGMCGAESGWVPVSAVAPDILLKEVEVQRRSKANDRPPILPQPQNQTKQDDAQSKNLTQSKGDQQ